MHSHGSRRACDDDGDGSTAIGAGEDTAAASADDDDTEASKGLPCLVRGPGAERWRESAKARVE